MQSDVMPLGGQFSVEFAMRPHVAWDHHKRALRSGFREYRAQSLYRPQSKSGIIYGVLRGFAVGLNIEKHLDHNVTSHKYELLKGLSFSQIYSVLSFVTTIS